MGCSINIEYFDPAIAQINEKVTLVDKYEGIGAVELWHILFLSRNQILDPQGPVLRFNQYVLVKLLYKLDFPQLAFECQTHQRLPSMNVYDSHGDLVVLRRIYQKHYPVAKGFKVNKPYQILNSVRVSC